MWFSDVVWENPNQRKEFMLTNVIFQHGLRATWKRYNMETLSSSLVFYEWNPPDTNGFLRKWPVMQSFLCLLYCYHESTAVGCLRFKTPWRPYDVTVLWEVGGKQNMREMGQCCFFSNYSTNLKDKNRGVPQATYLLSIMTSSNGNISRVTGPLCREFRGHRWIPRTRASDAELWCFLWSEPE